MMITSEYLSAKEYQILEAHNGLEAIKYAHEQHLDLILMDIQMPGISGIETIKQLRAEPKFASLPIIALTALAMPGDRELCLEAGATEYLSKPVSLKKLIEVIGNLLNKQIPIE
ncbi:MAG: response regulator [Anaerolineales bacterium]|nr:response regulator [Anaerolineales bacterium]